MTQTIFLVHDRVIVAEPLGNSLKATHANAELATPDFQEILHHTGCILTAAIGKYASSCQHYLTLVGIQGLYVYILIHLKPKTSK